MAVPPAVVCEGIAAGAGAPWFMGAETDDDGP